MTPEEKQNKLDLLKKAYEAYVEAEHLLPANHFDYAHSVTKAMNDIELSIEPPKSLYRVSYSRVYYADILIPATSLEDAYSKAYNLSPVTSDNVHLHEAVRDQFKEQNEWDSQDVIVHENDPAGEQRLISRLKDQLTDLLGHTNPYIQELDEL